MKRQLSNSISRLAACLLASLLLCGCQDNLSSRTAKATTPPSAPVPDVAAPQPSATPPSPSPTQGVSHTPVKDAVENLLQKEAASAHSLFPAGTKLNSAKMEGGVVTLDFNAAFNHLADMGDTTEAQAQRVLRRSLSPIPAVERMRVTVNGRPIESQMTDWTTPFAVRYEDSARTSDEQQKQQELDHKTFGGEQ